MFTLRGYLSFFKEEQKTIGEICSCIFIKQKDSIKFWGFFFIYTGCYSNWEPKEKEDWTASSPTKWQFFCNNLCFIWKKIFILSLNSLRIKLCFQWSKSLHIAFTFCIIILLNLVKKNYSFLIHLSIFIHILIFKWKYMQSSCKFEKGF